MSSIWAYLSMISVKYIKPYRRAAYGIRWAKTSLALLLILMMSLPAASETPPEVLKVICHVAMPWVVGNQVVEPLIYVDNQNNFIPCLAESYQTTEDHMDMTLRKNVVFHDGTPFSASSVLMNWSAYQRTADPYFTIDLRRGIRDIEALSSCQIRIWFKDNGLVGLMPVYLRSFYIYSPSYFKRSGGVYPAGNQANLLEPGLWGTGPYILKQVVEDGEVVTLKKNPRYWQKERPYIQTVMICGPKKFDSLTAHRLMKNGEADLFDAVAPSMLPALAQSDAVSALVTHPLSSLTTLFNMRKPGSPLRDLRVRKALNLLVDRRTLLKYLSRGHARMTAFIFPLSSQEGRLDPYPFNPEESASLLNDAGYTADHPLSLTIGYYASEEKLARAIGAMLEEGNVRTSFQKYQTRYEWYQHMLRSGHGPENPMESENWDLNIINIGLYTNSAATHFGECFVSEGGYRWILPDPKADEMFYHSVKRCRQKSCEISLLKLERYLYSQHYMMPIYISPTILAVRKRIAGSAFSESGYLLNLKEIKFDEGRQKIAE